MLHTKKHLDLCYELLLLKHQYVVKPGLTLGRRCPDDECEEYTVLTTEGSIVSLKTGEVTTLGEDFRSVYFPIYSADEISKLLYERRCGVEQLWYVDRRLWRLEVVSPDGENIRFDGETLEEVFVRTLIWRLVRV